MNIPNTPNNKTLIAISVVCTCHSMTIKNTLNASKLEANIFKPIKFDVIFSF